MTATKTNIVYAMEALAEASYDAGGVFAPATDAVLLAERAFVPQGFIFDGSRPNAAGTAGSQVNAAPSGRFVETQVVVEMRGSDVAYSGADTPRDLDVLLRAAGHSAVFTTDWTYAPESSGFESAALRLFTEGQQYDMTGVYADWRYDIDGPGFGRFTFDVKGRAAGLVDAAIPGAIAYIPSTILPPKAESLLFTLNGVATTRVRKVALIGGRATSQRPDLNAADAFAGYAAGRRAPMLEVTVEAEALATIDPWALWTAGTQFATSFAHGSVANNSMDFAAAQAQIVGVEVDDDDPVVLWNLVIKLPTSGQTADDDYTLTFPG